MDFVRNNTVGYFIRFENIFLVYAHLRLLFLGLVYWKHNQRPSNNNGWRGNGDGNSMVLRNRLLCPYYGYGSEIVYPIAEQSDEPSHPMDSDEEPAGNGRVPIEYN